MRRGAASRRLAGSCVAAALLLGLAQPATGAAAHPRVRTALLGVTVVGLPRGVRPAVTIDGPNGFRLRLARQAVQKRLVLGRYRITALRLRANAATYRPTVQTTKLSLAAGKRTALTVRYERLQAPAPTPEPTAPGGGADAPSGPPAGPGSSGGGGGGGGDAGPTLKSPAPSGFVCALTAVILGPPKAIVVTVQDPANGILAVTTTTTNATAVVSPFGPGTTGAIVVTATKLDQSQGSTLALLISDGSGQSVLCA
jgi:hypothetical protein